MRRVQSLWLAATVSILFFGSMAVGAPQQPEDCRLFPETGHEVCGEFLTFFDTHGGVGIFGYPLSRAFDDRERGLRVQYFQRARMEYHPYNEEPYRVQLGLLVDELGYSFPDVPADQIPPFNTAFHHYFPETRHVVSYAFLDYFREHGGVDIFGYPRSEFVYENGYIVQYFQRTRMEWHPEDRSGTRLRLTNIGELYIEKKGIPQEYLVPGRIQADPPALDVSASVRYVITSRQGKQTVFVYVTDQQGNPIEDVTVTMTVSYPTSKQQYAFEPTDEHGFTKHGFNILSSPTGQKVIIEVTATYGDLTTKTQTFFLPWH